MVDSIRLGLYKLVRSEVRLYISSFSRVLRKVIDSTKYIQLLKCSPSVIVGDIEDYPGLDSLPKYGIKVENGEVKVKANKTLLAANKRIKTMARRNPDNPSTFVIVGGGKLFLVYIQC